MAPVMDLHAAHLALRERYGKARLVMVKAEAHEALLATLDSLEGLLESLSPSGLGLENIQAVAEASLRILQAFGQREAAREYSAGLWSFLLSLGARVHEPLRSRLYELA